MFTHRHRSYKTVGGDSCVRSVFVWWCRLRCLCHRSALWPYGTASQSPTKIHAIAESNVCDAPTNERTNERTNKTNERAGKQHQTVYYICRRKSQSARDWRENKPEPHPEVVHTRTHIFPNSSFIFFWCLCGLSARCILGPGWPATIAHFPCFRIFKYECPPRARVAQ